MNTTLLREIQQAILAEPTKLDMSIVDCGTAACIAGWALRLSGNTHLTPFDNRLEKAKEILNLLDNQSSSLFFVNGWPKEFQINWYSSYTTTHKEHQAKVAVERIEHFINTGE